MKGTGGGGSGGSGCDLGRPAFKALLRMVSGVCDLGWVASLYVEEENGKTFLLRQIK